MKCCPKCGAQHIWIELVQRMHHIRCMCGLCVPVHEELEGGMFIRRGIKAKCVLPPIGSDRSKCLRILRDLGQATSGEIALRISETSEKASTILYNMEDRGLVRRAIWRNRGKKGGSTWELTEMALNLLGGEEDGIS